jgi:polar amino acid transport system substrate-binding protein
MKIKYLLPLLFLFIPFLSHTNQKITVAFGDALAPWVIPTNDSGIIIDIIKAALEPVGYQVVPIYYPYARRINSYRNNLVDISSDINTNTIKSENLTGHFSGYIYQYQNYLISLSENQFQLNSLDDVGTLSLISWQGAMKHLDQEYADIVSKNPHYTETHDQTVQVKMLFLKRVEVAQMDLHIFKYYRHQIQKSGEIDTTAKVDYSPVLGASPNGFLFKDEKIRDIFVERVTQLKSNGEFQKIFDKYTVE